VKNEMAKRDLSAGERAVLALIQEGYGPHNSVDNVFFNEANDAVIFVKNADGTSPLMANLSNLSTWRENGTIATDEELRSFWLHLQKSK
jgi:hypothetical protein